MPRWKCTLENSCFRFGYFDPPVPLMPTPWNGLGMKSVNSIAGLVIADVVFAIPPATALPYTSETLNTVFPESLRVTKIRLIA